MPPARDAVLPLLGLGYLPVALWPAARRKYQPFPFSTHHLQLQLHTHTQAHSNTSRFQHVCLRHASSTHAPCMLPACSCSRWAGLRKALYRWKLAPLTTSPSALSEYRCGGLRSAPPTHHQRQRRRRCRAMPPPRGWKANIGSEDSYRNSIWNGCVCAEARSPYAPTARTPGNTCGRDAGARQRLARVTSASLDQTVAAWVVSSALSQHRPPPQVAQTLTRTKCHRLLHMQGWHDQDKAVLHPVCRKHPSR